MKINQPNDIIEEFKKDRFSFIFLGGIHGVGKTTICDSVFTNLGYHCLTASVLIKAQAVRPDQNKLVENVANNQIALLNQLNLEKKRYPRLLLDGHYCLINKNHDIEAIDVDVFRLISPDVLILLKDCSQKILERLEKRDGMKWNQKLVKDFQKAEGLHAQRVAEQMGIPLYIIANEEE